MQIIKNQTIDQMAKQIRQETAATDDAIVAAQVADIIKNVRENGDEALKTYSATFDGVTPATWRVSETEIQAAMNNYIDARGGLTMDQIAQQMGWTKQ